MSPARKKRAKVKVSAAESKLLRAKLVKKARVTDGHRKKLAKLTGGEVRTLIRVKRKLGYKGSLHGKGADFF